MAELSKKEVEKSLDYSVKDGSFYSVMAGFGDTFLSPFAIKLGASNSEIGVLAAVPAFAASLAQQISARITEKTGERKKLMVSAAFLQGTMWLPILLTPFLFPQTPVMFLVLFASLYTFFAAFAALPWASLMGDLVPEETRGTFFGKRNEITGFVAFVCAAVAGAVLGWFDSATTVQFMGFAVPLWMLGFATIFFIAFLARMVSVHYLTKMAEPIYSPPTKEKMSFWKFLIRLKKENFGLFTLYVAGTQFAVNLAAPFFAVYVLKVLQLDFATYAIFNAATLFTQLISMPYWGKLADKYGNKTVLNVAGFLVPVVPVLWLFSKQPAYLVLVNAFGGFAWAGFNLLTFNYILDATEPSTRPRYIAHYNFVQNFAVFGGALAGGALATLFADKALFFLEGLMLLFLLSGLLRLVVAWALLPRIKENRLRYDLDERQFFVKVTAVYPLLGIAHRLEGAWHAGVKSVKTIGEKTKRETGKIGRIARGLSEKK